MTLVQDNSVQAINTALLSIKRDISAPTATTAGTTAGLEPGKTYNINISGNAETATTAKTARTATNANHAETATKMSNALTVNGKTYNGSEAVDAGVQTVANGGTGVTTQADINKAFIGNLDIGESDVTDGTEFVSSWASDNGFSETTEGAVNVPFKRKFSTVWNYIKSKISSVLGLTKDNYGGTAAAILDYVRGTSIKVRWGGPGIDSAEWYPAFNADGSAIEPINRTNIHAGTADRADRLTAFASWNNPYDYDATNGVIVYVYKITMASYFNSILVQIYDDINYQRCRRYVLGLWHTSGYGYNVSVTDLGGTKDNGLKVWMGTDGNVYLQADVYWTSRIAFSRLDDITDVTITKIGAARYGSNTDINGNVLFTPLADPIVDCGALRADQNLSSAQKIPQILKTDVLRAPNIDVNRNITLDNASGANLGAYGSEPLTIGFPSGTGDGQSLGFDRNSMQVRKNGEASTMYLNYYGGMVHVNELDRSDGGLKVKNKMVIPIGAPSQLEDGCIWIER